MLGSLDQQLREEEERLQAPVRCDDALGGHAVAGADPRAQARVSTAAEVGERECRLRAERRVGGRAELVDGKEIGARNAARKGNLGHRRRVAGGLRTLVQRRGVSSDHFVTHPKARTPMQRWDLTGTPVSDRSGPRVLFSTPEARGVVIDLAAGEELGEHRVPRARGAAGRARQHRGHGRRPARELSAGHARAVRAGRAARRARRRADAAAADARALAGDAATTSRTSTRTRTSCRRTRRSRRSRAELRRQG